VWYWQSLITTDSAAVLRAHRNWGRCNFKGTRVEEIISDPEKTNSQQSSITISFKDVLTKGLKLWILPRFKLSREEFAIVVFDMNKKGTL